MVSKNNIYQVKDEKLIEIDNITFGNTDKLKLIYSSADVLLAPSTLEAFGQISLEASSCGVPVIGFKNTGLEDTIIHKQTGYLANYLDQKDFDLGINWVFGQLSKNDKYFREKCIRFVNDNFNYEFISTKYIEVYKEILKY